MTEQRLPKPGEVWRGRTSDSGLTIVNVYPDAVTFRYDNGDGEDLYAASLDHFVRYYSPPGPTVLSSKWLLPIPADTTRFVTYDVKPGPSATHRLDLMSDGTFRVVEL